MKLKKNQQDIDYSQYVTIGTAAKNLGISISTLRNWDKDGTLASCRNFISSYRLYKIKDIEMILEILLELDEK